MRRLLAHLPDYLRPVVKPAYYTAMSKGEILKLTWEHVDLREGFYPFEGRRTPRPSEGRSVPLDRGNGQQMLTSHAQGDCREYRSLPIKGKSIKDVKRLLQNGLQERLRLRISPFTI